MFDWSHYLNLGQKLRSPGLEVDEEAQCRSAISRFYYSVMHIVQKYLIEHESYVPVSHTQGSTHSHMERFLRDKGTKLGGVYNNFKRLREMRVVADYSANFKYEGMPSADVSKCAEYAEGMALRVLDDIEKKKAAKLGPPAT